MDAQGRWRTRSRYVVTEAEHVAVQISQKSRLTKVRWNGQSVLVRPRSDRDTFDLLDVAATQTPGLLEIETDSVDSVGPVAWDNLALDVPALLGSLATSKIFWQIDVPDGISVVRGPDNYGDENEWRWRGRSLRMTARMDEDNLERWLTGTAEPRVPVASRQRLLYSRLISHGRLELTIASRWLLVLTSSGLVMLIGLCLVALPRRGILPFLFAIATAAVFFASVEPLAAAACLSSAGWGLLLSAFAGASHVALMRRRLSGSSVFPEPAYLASTRGSSRWSGAHSGEGGAVQSSTAPTGVVTS
jgi:hypothetical protein